MKIKYIPTQTLAQKVYYSLKESLLMARMTGTVLNQQFSSAHTITYTRCSLLLSWSAVEEM